MRNIALTLRYLGTAYHGWQVQKNDITVGQTLEKAAAMVVGRVVIIELRMRELCPLSGR